MLAIEFDQLSALGLTPALANRAAGLAAAEGATLEMLRVTVVHRSTLGVHDGRVERGARPLPRLARALAEEGTALAVGDWVLATRDAYGETWVEARVPPSSHIARRDGDGCIHPVVSNVDTALLLMGLDDDFNPRRLERYLALALSSDVTPVVVLTKADIVDREAGALEARIAELDGRLPPQTELLAVDGTQARTAQRLAAFLDAGQTLVVLGSSGAGKSTLTNTLLGVERQATNSVRGHDSRGRHTTTHRALIALPSGGCLIDTPGMRELKLTGDENLGEAGFADIEALALQCRFGDCGHGNEPGCAVRAALDSGALERSRWDSFIKLRAELAATNDTLEAQLRRKSQARVANKALNKRLGEKYRGS